MFCTNSLCSPSRAAILTGTYNHVNGVTSNSDFDARQNVNFGPTFLDLAGVAAPPDMQGRSAREVLRGAPPPDWRTSM